MKNRYKQFKDDYNINDAGLVATGVVVGVAVTSLIAVKAVSGMSVTTAHLWSDGAGKHLITIAHKNGSITTLQKKS